MARFCMQLVDFIHYTEMHCWFVDIWVISVSFTFFSNETMMILVIHDVLRLSFCIRFNLVFLPLQEGPSKQTQPLFTENVHIRGNFNILSINSFFMGLKYSKTRVLEFPRCIHYRKA